MSDSEASHVSYTSQSQRFEPQDDDEETLWEVIEITAEKGNTYKVRWKGVDPKTMKPWPQSWVRKSDCTDDLVQEWKRKVKEKGKGKRKQPTRGGRAPTASKRTKRDSTSTVGAAAAKQPVASSSRTNRRSTSSVTTTTTVKTTSKSKLPPVSKTPAAPAIEVDDSEVEEPQPPRSSAKGKKRKLQDATSANSSANQALRGTSVDVNVDQDGEAINKPPASRPWKKRKVEVEITKIESESELEQPVQSALQGSQEESYDIRKVAGKIAPLQEAEEDEDEERMIEDALSQASPPPLPDYDDMDDIYVPDEPIIAPQPHATISALKDKRNEEPLFLSSRNSPASVVKYGPPTKSRPSLPKQNRSSKSKSKETEDGAVAASRSPPPGPTSPADSPPASVVLRRRSSDIQHRMPTEERSVFWTGANEEQHPKPQLSPAAEARLAQFDEEVMGIPPKARNRSATAESASRDSAPAGKASVEANTEASEKAVVAIVTEQATNSGTASSAAVSRSSKEAEKGKQVDDNKSSRSKRLPSAAPAISKLRVPPSRAAKPPSHSYNTEVVPETDSSQSQESQIPVGPPAPSDVNPQPKTRSPTPEAGGTSTKSKKLGPIPVLSPSVFHPHLSLPSASLTDEISEELSQQAAAKARENISIEDEDALMSSIEQFESPEKQVRPAVIVAPKEQRKGKARAGASDIWNTNVVQRGLELAEAAKKARGVPPAPQKKSMDDVIAETRARSNSAVSGTSSEHLLKLPTPIPEDEEEDTGGASTDVVPSASEQQQIVFEESHTLSEMEQAFVDLTGGTDDSQNVPRSTGALRQEEEESTQDMMMEIHEIHQHQRVIDESAIENGWDLGPAVSDSIPMDVVIEPTTDAIPMVETNGALDTIPEATEAPPVAPHANELLPLPRMTRSRSRSKTPMPPVARTNGRGRKGTSSSRNSAQPTSDPTPAPVPIAVPTTVPDPISTSAPLATDPALEQRLTILIANLQRDLAAERSKTADLLQQRAAALHAQSEAKKQHGADADTQVAQLVAQHQAEREAWENEKLQLSVQLDSAIKARASADTDREFFREQYAKASGFVSSVRDENKDLEKRVKIAEGQTQTGVNLIKATFELRLQALEEDLKSWRRMAEFLIEKDRRTGNDDIRRRAAEEPELRALCQRQAASYAKAQDRIFNLEADLDEQRRDYADLEATCQALKSETTALNVELNEANIKLERIGRIDEYGNAAMDTTDNGHEFVYSCKWRTDRNEPCQNVFSTISELEQHLRAPGGHLHTT